MANVAFLKPGTRTFITGKTGSGKSTVAVTLLKQSTQKWLLIDPKQDDKIATLKPYRPKKMTPAEVWRGWQLGFQFVAVTPPPKTSPMDVDAFMLECFEEFKNFGLYVDELYFIHNSGGCGPGLTAILTRGRSEKVTFMGATQRPAFVSLFCITEADYIAQFRLALDKDRKRIYEVTGVKAMLSNPPANYGWYYYTVSNEDFRYFVPPGG